MENTKGLLRKLTGSVCWNAGCHGENGRKGKGRRESDHGEVCVAYDEVWTLPFRQRGTMKGF